MSTIQEQSLVKTQTSRTRKTDFKLEAIVVPVSDVNRAKSYYSGLGWRLDADFLVGDSLGVVQCTPPGSPTSIHFGKGLTPAAPGVAQNLYLVVSDIETARAELVKRGAKVTDVFHRADLGQPPLGGRDPAGRSYASFASFNDPDGNAWVLQEITARLPGRLTRKKRLSPRRLHLQLRFVARRPRMASMRSGPVRMMQTGRIGTPNT
jgi:hypothetical protein